MFSGIITEIGFLRPVKCLTTPSSTGNKQVRVRVLGALKIFKHSVGDSVSVNGVCLTIVSKDLVILKLMFLMRLLM